MRLQDRSRRWRRPTAERNHHVHLLSAILKEEFEMGKSNLSSVRRHLFEVSLTR